MDLWTLIKTLAFEIIELNINYIVSQIFLTILGICIFLSLLYVTPMIILILVKLYKDFYNIPQEQPQKYYLMSDE